MAQETTRHSYEDQLGFELMSLMVENSQRPGEGNLDFVHAIGAYLTNQDLTLSYVNDPEYKDRSLLVVDIGDPEGEQVLSAVSHSDVVGVDNQTWQTDPWKLTEDSGQWYGRGTCDTHGSGVSMLLAGMRGDVSKTLADNNKRVSIIFTYDEESTGELGYRGARAACGLYGQPPVAESKYFIVGEPTEIDGLLVPTRAHKGRLLVRYGVEMDNPGHSAENVDNALMYSVEIAHKIGEMAFEMKTSGFKDRFFSPGYSTIQITGAGVKDEAYSTTPGRATMTADLRSLPGDHESNDKLLNLIKSYGESGRVNVTHEVLDYFKSSESSVLSRAVIAAEEITGHSSIGFNGGDESGTLRDCGKEGVTLGPGELKYAHTPDERISIASVVRAADIYAQMFISFGRI